MLKQIRSRMTYANVMSTVAAFLALGGGAALAASRIDTGEIQRRAITGPLIQRAAVSAKHIDKFAVDTPELARRAIVGRHIERRIIKGSHIDPATTLPIQTTVRTEEFTLAPETQSVVNLDCNSNEVAVGGGYRINTPAAIANTATGLSAPKVVQGETLWQLEISTAAFGNYTGFVNCMTTAL